MDELRNLVFLLIWLGANEEATEPLGAIDITSTTAQVYGVDATRLRSAAVESALTAIELLQIRCI